MKLRIYSYSAEFRQAFTLAGHTITNREGLLFELIDNDAHHPFLAEAAPLPGFSSDTLEEVMEWSDDSGDWKQWLAADQPPKYEEEIPASLRFALSSLWFERKAHQQKNTLQHYLSEGRAHRSITVNKAIGLGEPKDILTATRRAVNDGFRTLKYKVGSDTDKEVDAIRQVRDSFPDINIRLDANGAWDTSQAKEALKAFEPMDIEYCEQPLPPGKIEADAWLRTQTFIPIAADESVRSFEEARIIMLKGLADVLIVKPMLIGSVTAYMDILKLADASGVKVVVTTSLDSGVARRITAKLASVIRISPYAHGLATGSMFADGADPCPDADLIQNGTYMVSDIEPCANFKDTLKLIHEINF